jgi:S-formylglutathione hydrolase
MDGREMTVRTLSEWAAHGGRQLVCRHDSEATGTAMTFSLFLPGGEGPWPLLTYLSGLACTHANVTEKGEYRAAAARHGLAVLCTDTSPRGEGVPDDEAYDMGQGAGFYLDATRAPWAEHFRMASYAEEELPALVAKTFPVDRTRQGIAGHSMGGHGALTMALRNPGRYRSVSAFAPIVAPTQVPWGRKALPAYLGDDPAAWRRHDAVALIEDGAEAPPMLVDQGTADDFLEEQLRPDLLRDVACGLDLTLRMQKGYDHSYYFVSTFMAEHVAWHADHLGIQPGTVPSP